MKRTLPLAVAFLGGLFMLLQYFTPHPGPARVYETFLNWSIIIGFFALCLGMISLWLTHLPKVVNQAPGWGYNAVTLIGFVVTAIFGLIWGKAQGTPLVWVYDNLLNPITSTMFALLAFFIASAAYRAFRARSTLSLILLISAVVVMLGRVPIGDSVLDKILGVFPEQLKISDLVDIKLRGVLGQISGWLLNYPNVAAKRAIVIGVGFGGIATALKIMLGIERSYLGGGDR